MPHGWVHLHFPPSSIPLFLSGPQMANLAGDLAAGDPVGREIVSCVGGWALSPTASMRSVRLQPAGLRVGSGSGTARPSEAGGLQDPKSFWVCSAGCYKVGGCGGPFVLNATRESTCFLDCPAAGPSVKWVQENILVWVGVGRCGGVGLALLTSKILALLAVSSTCLALPKAAARPSSPSARSEGTPGSARAGHGRPICSTQLCSSTVRKRGSRGRPCSLEGLIHKMGAVRLA